MQQYAARLKSIVERASGQFLEIPDDAAGVRPHPNKWSPKEIVGHLIDSASNNHQRFLRAQFQADLVFPGYAQESWVEAQCYAETPWAELVELWRAFNLHIVRVMAAAPESLRMRSVDSHNFDEIAWQTVPRDRPTTLDYFMEDYVDHLEHHVRQVLGGTEFACSGHTRGG